MKLQEHENIENSEEERVRLSAMSLQDRNKAREAFEKEKEAIKAIEFKMIGNGFTRAVISHILEGVYSWS